VSEIEREEGGDGVIKAYEAKGKASGAEHVLRK